MNNLLTNNANGSAFENFINGTIEMPNRLSVGTHKCIFKGLEPDMKSNRLIIKLEKDGKEYKDAKKFDPEKQESLMFTLTEIARQFNIEGNFIVKDLNKYIGHEITVYAIIPKTFKSVCYNYKETIKPETTVLAEDEKF